MNISIVMADDHSIFLTGLEAVLRRERDLDILACCATGDETLLAVRKHRPDVLLLDLHLPGGGLRDNPPNQERKTRRARGAPGGAVSPLHSGRGP
jgi:DNA-binding NarL/FixJ family response regulator